MFGLCNKMRCSSKLKYQMHLLQLLDNPDFVLLKVKSDNILMLSLCSKIYDVKKFIIFLALLSAFSPNNIYIYIYNSHRN